MKTKTLLTLTLIAFSFLCFSQGVEPFQSHKEKWGFKDKDGKIVIEPQFDNILRLKRGSGDAPFPKDFFVVNNGGEIVEILGSVFYEDLNGSLVESFYLHREAIVGGKFGVINSLGEFILEPYYDYLIINYEKFDEDWEGYIRSQINISDTTGYNYNRISDSVLDFDRPIIACLNGKWGATNYKGEILIDFIYDGYDYYSSNLSNYFFYSNNMHALITDRYGTPVFIADEYVLNNSRHSYIIYNYCEKLYEHKKALFIYCFDCVVDTLNYTSRLSYLDPENGFDIIQEQNMSILSLTKGDFYLLAADGKRITNNTFDNIYYYINYSDYTNQERLKIISLKINRVEAEEKNLACTGDIFSNIAGSSVYAVKGNKWWQINIEDRTIKELDFIIEEFNEGFLNVSKAGKASLYNIETGKLAPFSKKYDGIELLSNGFYKVKKEHTAGKWETMSYYKYGLYSDTGLELLPCTYSEIGSFNSGLAKVKPYTGEFCNLGYPKYEKSGYINEAIELVIPYRFDASKDFSEGLAAVNIDGKWGYINTSGKTVIPMQYDDAKDFSKGKAWVRVNSDSYYINKDGERE